MTALELKKLQQERAKSDLKYLFEEVLGYDKLDDFHLEIIENLKRVEQTKKGLFLLPRGHWKSTLITIAYVIQRILRDPNISIFISNATLNNASAFLREIKGHFEKSERLRELFGNLVGEKWSDTEFIIASRTAVHKEPTVRAGSVDHSVVSAHFDLIVFDDLCNRENVNTKEQCDKVIQYYKDALALGKEAKTEYLVVGTRWHFADLYEFILDQNRKFNNFTIVHKTCWKDKIKKIPLFYKFSVEHLLSLQEEMGSYDFIKQYENEVVDDSSATFKQSWLQQTYSEDAIKTKPLHTFVALDLAMSTKKGSDYTGLVVVSTDAAKNWYIRYVKKLQVNTTDLINLVFDIWSNTEWKKSGLQIIGAEQKAFQDLISPMLKSEGERRNVFPVTKELKDLGRSKTDRIKGALVGRFEFGKIYFREDAEDDTLWLKEELLKFPFAKNDDLSDALAYIEDIATYPHIEAVKIRTETDKKFYDHRKSTGMFSSILRV